MKRPIVLIVRHASLHALLFDRRRNVVWHANAELSDAGALANAVSTLLLAAASKARGRPVVALLGCAHAQLKMITGLPQIADVGVLTRIIGETPRRFFAVGGIATVTGLAERDENNRVWCAAYDRAIVDEIVTGVAAARLRLAAVVPILAFAPAYLANGETVYIDDNTEVVAHVEHGRLAAITRRRRPTEAAIDAEQLAEQESIELAAARCATTTHPLAWRPAPAGSFGGHGRRLAVLSAAAVTLALIASLAGTAGAIRAGSAASARLVNLGDAPRQLATATAALQQTTSSIEQIEHFAESRRSICKLLRDITKALPDSTAITTLRVDSIGVALTAVSPHVADIVPALTSVSGAVMPQLAGAATREMIGGARLERATLRFRFPHSASSRTTTRRTR